MAFNPDKLASDYDKLLEILPDACRDRESATEGLKPNLIASDDYKGVQEAIEWFDDRRLKLLQEANRTLRYAIVSLRRDNLKFKKLLIHGSKNPLFMAIGDPSSPHAKFLAGYVSFFEEMIQDVSPRLKEIANNLRRQNRLKDKFAIRRAEQELRNAVGMLETIINGRYANQMSVLAHREASGELSERYIAYPPNNPSNLNIILKIAAVATIFLHSAIGIIQAEKPKDDDIIETEGSFIFNDVPLMHKGKVIPHKIVWSKEASYEQNNSQEHHIEALKKQGKTLPSLEDIATVFTIALTTVAQHSEAGKYSPSRKAAENFLHEMKSGIMNPGYGCNSIMTSTRVRYDPDSTKITHHVGDSGERETIAEKECGTMWRNSDAVTIEALTGRIGEREAKTSWNSLNAFAHSILTISKQEARGQECAVFVGGVPFYGRHREMAVSAIVPKDGTAEAGPVFVIGIVKGPR